MNYTVYNLDSRFESPKYINQIEDIFFTCSSIKKFENEEKKTNLKKKWLYPYFDSKFKKYFFVAYNEEDDQILGYLSGCLNSKDFLESSLYQNPMLHFSSYLPNYPAHFHINVNPDFHGHGIGRKLVSKFEGVMLRKNVDAWHIITGDKSDNVQFYKSVGATFSKKHTTKLQTLMFMGKSLSWP